MRSLTKIGVLAVSLFIVGCSHKEVKTDEVGSSAVVPKNLIENPDLKMVHFPFNQSVLTKQAKNILKQDAATLKADSSLKFQIQGFCDERGSVEYNLSLGQRRAEAVRSYLETLGIAAERISIISYGKANPLDQRENEAAYAINRRASFSINNSSNHAAL